MSSEFVSANLLRTYVDYMIWAANRLMASVADLSPDELTQDFHTSDKSILGTLVHIFAADRTWLARLRGGPIPPFVTDADRSLSALQSEWPKVQRGWQEWAASLTDTTAQAELSYQDLKGNTWTQPVWQPVLQVVNHGTHHRGQVSGFLRALGKTPPPLDLILYFRQQAK